MSLDLTFYQLAAEFDSFVEELVLPRYVVHQYNLREKYQQLSLDERFQIRTDLEEDISELARARCFSVYWEYRPIPTFGQVDQRVRIGLYDRTLLIRYYFLNRAKLGHTIQFEENEQLLLLLYEVVTRSRDDKKKKQAPPF